MRTNSADAESPVQGPNYQMISKCVRVLSDLNRFYSSRSCSFYVKSRRLELSEEVLKLLEILMLVGVKIVEKGIAWDGQIKKQVGCSLLLLCSLNIETWKDDSVVLISFYLCLVSMFVVFVSFTQHFKQKRGCLGTFVRMKHLISEFLLVAAICSFERNKSDINGALEHLDRTVKVLKDQNRTSELKAISSMYILFFVFFRITPQQQQQEQLTRTATTTTTTAHKSNNHHNNTQDC